MQKLFALCTLVVSIAAERCGDVNCERNAPHGRSLLQKDAASSLEQGYGAVDDVRDASMETDDNERKTLTTSVDLDVKIMENEVADMQEKMKVIEDTLGVAPTTSGTDATTDDKEKKTTLQQITSEPGDNLKARVGLLETNVAELLSRTSVVEEEVGVPPVSLLDITNDPVIGIANRAIAVYLKVHNLQGRIAKMENTVVVSLKPDATLLKTKVEVLEDKMKILKASVQGPVSSLLGIVSSDGGLKSQVSDLETRMGELLSTTAMLETEVNGPVRNLANEEALLQKGEIHGLVPGAMGMVNRARALHAKVRDLQARIAKLEHTVLDRLNPDATLLKKEVGILEDKVKTLKSSVQGPASLLGIGSSEEGLKSQVSDLETRVGELLSTTAALETEVHGPSSEALLQKDGTDGKQGLVPRVSVLKSKVSNLKSRVFALEHHVTGL